MVVHEELLPPPDWLAGDGAGDVAVDRVLEVGELAVGAEAVAAGIWLGRR